MQGKFLLILNTFLASSISILAQQNLVVYGHINNKEGKPLASVNVFEVGVNNMVQSNSSGNYSLSVQHQSALIRFSYNGYETKEIRVSSSGNHDIILNAVSNEKTVAQPMAEAIGSTGAANIAENGAENPFRNPGEWPVSGFSVNVDGTSYSNIYRYGQNAELPFEKLVRIEEMINYFKYDYPRPNNDDEQPFTLNTELSVCPWNKEHKLLLIGLQGKEIPVDNLPASNLVFLIDASKSMSDPLKLPLVKASMKLLAQQLRKKDLVSVVAYAGSAAVNLIATPGDKKNTIEKSIDELVPNGNTAGAAGIKMAYRVARQNFIAGGNNRIILCTDGDFNIGISSDAAIDSLIEAERKSGVLLSVMGFGSDNRHAAKMKRWAEIGNGNHNIINSMNEAKRLFVNEYASTFYSIAREVKPQVYFNPAKVQQYRLIGYDIKDDNKISNSDQLFEEGEFGSGHSITALYEIIPRVAKPNTADTISSVMSPAPLNKLLASDMGYIDVQYRLAGTSTKKTLNTHVKDETKLLENSSDNFRFASAVAEAGLLLRDSDFKQKANYKDVITLAKSALGKDESGFRSAFVTLAENFSRIAKQTEGKSWLKKKSAL